MTPERLRQISAEIGYRKHQELKERMHMASLQAQVTAATFGGEKAAREVAKAFHIPDIEPIRDTPSLEASKSYPAGLDFDPENPTHIREFDASRLAKLGRVL